MDKVRSQYERWIYPAPVDDLVAWTAGGGITIGDAKDFADLYWPDTGYREAMNILIAGCGANQAARYAFVHPGASVTGIDLSDAALAHGDKLKKKHGLGNLTLRRMRGRAAGTLDAEFDFIACSGVLHHLPDPLAGLKALGGVLASDGVIYVMLYGRYGRAPVYMMQELFRILGTDDKPATLTGQRAPPLTLPPPLVAIFHQVDGKRSIRQCIEASGNDLPAAELLGHGLRFFRSLSRTGHVVFRLDTKAR
jgi:SAM-dependent methyltransferase